LSKGLRFLTHNTPIRNRKAALTGGFSTVEIVMAIAIALILMAIAVPSAMTMYQNYQLNDAATQLSGILKFTRAEAIRLNGGSNAGSTNPNHVITCLNSQAAPGSPTSLWATTNATETAAQATERQILLGTGGTLVDSGTVSGSGALASAAGLSAITGINPSSGSVAFDSRGAVYFGGNPQTVYAYFIGNSAGISFRAVLVLPSGSIQVWTSPSGSTWTQVG
jgi:Tfp pilus assembly protein FimT